MAGQVSEESCEAYTGTLAETKSLLKSMPSTKTIAQVTNERSQANLKGSMLKGKLGLKQGVTKVERGPNRTPRRRNVDKRNLKMVAEEVVEFGGDLYGKLVNGYLVPRAWCDIYK